LALLGGAVNEMNFLLTAEAARLAGVSGVTIRAWERNGRLRAIRTPGGTRLFAREDVERAAAERNGDRASNAVAAFARGKEIA
jgi:excisionase family DNA binding protein